MASGYVTKKECIVRPAKDKNEARDVAWPLLQFLGWNRAEEDTFTHYAVTTAHTGPSGWLHVADKETPDKPEGCVLPIVFDNGTGWVGLFCLNEPVQGRGWGGALFAEMLSILRKSNLNYAGLDAVKQQVKTYERRGFVATSDLRVMSHASLKTKPLPGAFEHVDSLKERLVPLEDIPGRILTQHELAVTGFERSKLWSKEALFHRQDAWGLALVAEGTKEELEGYLLVRSCPSGFRLGPLYANSKKHAHFLVHQAMYRLQDEDGDFIAEVWMNNSEAVKAFEELGWEWVNVDYYRMWLDGKVPPEQQKDGRSSTEMWAVFDAAEG